MEITLKIPGEQFKEGYPVVKLEADCDGNWHIDTKLCEVIVHDCYHGIGFKTDQGMIGVAMRDGGVEVQINGVPAWSSVHGLVE